MKLNHLGIIVNNIEKHVENYKKIFDAQLCTSIIRDDFQQAKLCLLKNDSLEFYWELIEPIRDSRLFPFLQKGGGLHHQCYEVENIDESMKHFRKTGAIPALGPVPAPLFNNHQVVFIVMPDRTLIELLEV
ncbi:VOC family protein [Aneurinibacillus terranovensis]|uniref:VOC family protein n=1 Tax=Aneurinibacillus terranovensis TaxID=278991 RepID=UPI000683DBAB|nr:VOC family protein [Aneurinibacillus terranovensis]